MNKFDFGYVSLQFNVPSPDEKLNMFLSQVRAWRVEKSDETTREIARMIGKRYKEIEHPGSRPLQAMRDHLMAFSDELPPEQKAVFAQGWWIGYGEAKNSDEIAEIVG